MEVVGEGEEAAMADIQLSSIGKSSSAAEDCLSPQQAKLPVYLFIILPLVLLNISQTTVTQSVLVCVFPLARDPLYGNGRLLSCTIYIKLPYLETFNCSKVEA